MKSAIISIFLSFSCLAYGTVFYVQDRAYNENASDTNRGDNINFPWSTWQKAFNTAQPGDTVYFRGGTWFPETDNYGNVTMYHPRSGHGYHGTRSNPICFIAYPPDVEEGNMPVLDCRNTHPINTGHVGLNISTTGYVKFKGLKVTNVRSWPQESGEMWCAGIMVNEYGHLTLEEMTVSYIGGAGIFLMDGDTLFMVNCDSHNNCDSLDLTLPGNDADGYTLLDDSPVSDSFRFTYIAGCRAWENSDDGFNISPRKQLIMHDCWSFNNGDLLGDYNGFKLKFSHLQTTWKRVIYNCIAACNPHNGFTDLNLNYEIGPFMEYLNNVAYKCGTGFGSGKGKVFECGTHPASVIYRNNISYASTGPYPATFKACDYQYPSYVIQDHNTWVQTGSYFHTMDNSDYTVTADDFISLDTLQLRWPRKTDGSLPDITFMKLKSSSELIGGGVDVGLAYSGVAPDLGASQNGPFSVELTSPFIFREFTIGDPVVIQAKIENSTEEIQEVRFYLEDGERLLGQGNRIASSVWQYTWESDEIGYQALRAVAVNTRDESAKSSIVRIRVKKVLHSTSLHSEDFSLCKIIPNPNNGLFSLELTEPLKESIDIQVISMMGKVVAVEKMAADEIIKELDLTTLLPGFYNIQLKSGNHPPPCSRGVKMVKF